MDAFVGSELAAWVSVLLVVFLVLMLMATRYVFFTQAHEGNEKKTST